MSTSNSNWPMGRAWLALLGVLAIPTGQRLYRTAFYTGTGWKLGAITSVCCLNVGRRAC